MHRPREQVEMATKIFFLIALICTVKANPLGQTICDTPGFLSTLIPGYRTTVCESPNVHPYTPHGLGSNGLSATVRESAPNIIGLGYGLPYGPLATPFSNTVCESAPNVSGIGYGVPVSTLGSTTACESAPSVTPNLLGLNHGIPSPLTSTTVCESAPNGLGCGLGHNGVGLGVSGLGHNGWADKCVGGICPLSLGLGLGYPLPYAGLEGLRATTFCESNPNLLGVGYLPGLGLGLGANGLGATMLCENNPNLLALAHRPTLVGLGSNGLAGVGLGANPLDSTTASESAPSVLGLGLGHPYTRSFL